MREHPFHHLAGRLHRLYRDRENGLIFGVCAGIADYFDTSALLVRGLALLAFWFALIPTALAYLIAAMLLRDRPLVVRDGLREREFWRHGGTMGDHL